jgi:hypothetical protein
MERRVVDIVGMAHERPTGGGAVATHYGLVAVMGPCDGGIAS